jgi:hypothetical protein
MVSIFKRKRGLRKDEELNFGTGKIKRSKKKKVRKMRKDERIDIISGKIKRPKNKFPF